MTYEQQINMIITFLYNETKCFATSSTYHIPYKKIESAYDLWVGTETVQHDIRDEFGKNHLDRIQALDFDDTKEEVVVMMWESNNKKKYTINDYKEFNNNALVLPPLDEFENGNIDEQEWYENHKIHIVVGNHDMELNYLADNVTEIYSALEEMYEIEKEVNEEINNNCTEFKTKLTEAFKTHMFMDNREQHTVNELLYVLEHDSRFNGEDFNISICTLDHKWWAIPCVDADGDDSFVEIVVKVPTGSKDEAYDGYALAEEYDMKAKEKAEKAAEAEAKKQAKIKRDEAKRKQLAESKAKHNA